jgi:hypothetical protein
MAAHDVPFIIWFDLPNPSSGKEATRLLYFTANNRDCTHLLTLPESRQYRDRTPRWSSPLSWQHMKCLSTWIYLENPFPGSRINTPALSRQKIKFTRSVAFSPIKAANIVVEGPVISISDLVVAAHEVLEHLGRFTKPISGTQNVLHLPQCAVPRHVLGSLEEGAVDPGAVEPGAADGRRIFGGNLCKKNLNNQSLVTKIFASYWKVLIQKGACVWRKNLTVQSNSALVTPAEFSE